MGAGRDPPLNVQAAGGDLPPYPSFAEATKVWARIGLLSFGGPAGQIALMHRELVEERRWISEERFLHALNFCMLLPGPEAQQLATYIGWLLHGRRGGIVAGTLFVMPGFVVILALSIFYALFLGTAWLNDVFFGLKAAVLAIVVEATIRVGRRALKNAAMVALAAIAFVALFAFGIPFPLVVLGAGVVGYVGARLGLAGFSANPHAAKAVRTQRPALIGSDLQTAAAPRENALATVALWGLLWLAPLAIMLALGAGGGVFTDIFAFFSQMAVVTFGGAYAVLAYVAQQAVDHYGWLRPGEMLDGLALAETTPGPLVMVLSFVGFLAAFREASGLPPVVAGTLGAVLTTWVTFVPCFLWIFLGAPYVERLRANVALSAALAAITAAVVGVILNLAVWFGLHVLFTEVGQWQFGPMTLPRPQWATFQPAAAALSVVAAVLLLGLKQSVVRTLLISAILGYGWSALA